MKTIFIFTAGSIANFIIAEIAAHPQIIDVVLGVLLGALFALLMAVIFVGPSESEQKQETQKPQTQPRKPAQRKPRRIIEQSTPKAQYGLNIFNYTPTEWGIA